MNKILKKTKDTLYVLFFIIIIFVFIGKVYYQSRIDYLLKSTIISYENNSHQLAESKAKKLVNICDSFSLLHDYKLIRHWNYGNAVHEAHTILGLIYFKEGNITTAKKHLIESGKTPGSPQLNTFGPSMLLANSLLKIGEKEAVIHYLELTQLFWDGYTTNNWIYHIKQGTMNDFTENMRL